MEYAETYSCLKEYSDIGDWDFVIKLCEDGITSFIKSLPNPRFDGGVATRLYFASKAYKAKGEKDKYIACLKILYSLEPYGHAVGEKYRDLLDSGVKDYKKLSEDVGVKYLNEFQVTGLFKEKSGCFIATAAFDSPVAHEVIILRQFRDKILLRNLIGKIFVNIYYYVSPSVAILIGNFNFAKKIIRAMLYPFIKLIERIDSN